MRKHSRSTKNIKAYQNQTAIGIEFKLDLPTLRALFKGNNEKARH